MKNFNISISKAKIFSDVALTTAYTGAKSDSPGMAFDKVATIDADSKLLSNFWKEMTGTVMEKLKPFIASVDLSGNDFSFEIIVSNAYDDSQTPSLEEDLNSVFSAGITARWFRFVSPEKASEWEAESSRCLDLAFSKLCYRRPPRRQS